LGEKKQAVLKEGNHY